MYEELKKLFGTDTPSVRLFKIKLKELSEEEQTFYYQAALHAAFLIGGSCPIVTVSLLLICLLITGK